jgi:hypothetical protein
LYVPVKQTDKLRLTHLLGAGRDEHVGLKLQARQRRLLRQISNDTTVYDYDDTKTCMWYNTTDASACIYIYICVLKHETGNVTHLLGAGRDEHVGLELEARQRRLLREVRAARHVLVARVGARANEARADLAGPAVGVGRRLHGGARRVRQVGREGAVDARLQLAQVDLNHLRGGGGSGGGGGGGRGRGVSVAVRWGLVPLIRGLIEAKAGGAFGDDQQASAVMSTVAS